MTAADLKRYVRIDDTDDDTEIGFAIAAASRAVDRATNRQFGVVDEVEARYYVPVWDRRAGVYRVEIDDLMTSTGLVVTLADGSTLPAEVTAGDGGYVLASRNAPQRGRPWTELLLPVATSDVTVTAWWGWSEVPAGIAQATLLQASRFFKRKDAPFGVAGSPDLGSELRLLAKVDPDVEVAVGPYRRWWGAV